MSWTVEQVGEWLQKIKLDHLCPIFHKHHINGECLIEFAAAYATDLPAFKSLMFNDLGVVAVGDVFRILHHLKKM